MTMAASPDRSTRLSRRAPSWSWTRRLTTCAIVAAAWLVPATSNAAHDFSFEQDGRGYTFTSRFVVEASPEQVLAVLYPFENLRQYARRTAAVDLIEEGPDWQVVRFTYDNWLWSLSVTYRREVDCSGRCIRFEMLEARRTGLPVPVPLRSRGECRFEPVPEGSRVTCVQTSAASDTRLLRAWMAWAKSRAVAYSKDLESYVRARLS